MSITRAIGKWFSLLKHVGWALLINGILLIFPKNKLTHKVLYTKVGHQANKHYQKGNIVILLLYYLHWFAAMTIQ